MAGTAILKVDIISDASKALKSMDAVEKKSGGLGKSLLKLGSVIGGAFAVGAVVSFGKSAFNAATEAMVANRRLEAVFESMGDATGEAAAAAKDYAGELSKSIAVEDEVIMAGQALLATFGNVSSEAARTAGIFDRATAAGADLAAAGFGSIESNAKTLGKALQDPVKGITALTKSGVTFTAEQKKMIKEMVAAGDVLGAQNIILGEVEKQVGGTAAATATAGGKMGIAFGELQEQIGNFLIPIVNKLAIFFTDVLFPAVEETLNALRPHINRFVDAFRRGFDTVVAWVTTNWPQIRDTIVDAFRKVRAVVIPIVQKISKVITTTLVPAFQKVAAAVAKVFPDLVRLLSDVGTVAARVFPPLLAALKSIVPVVAVIVSKFVELVGWLSRNRDVLFTLLAPVLAYVAAMKAWAIIQGVVTIATQAWTAVQAVLNAVMTANPIFLVVAAVAALVAGIILAYKRVDWFRKGVDTAFKAVVVAFKAVTSAAKATFEWIKGNWPTLLAILTGPFGIAVLIIRRNWDTIKEGASAVYSWVTGKFASLVGFVQGIGGQLAGAVAGVVNAIKMPMAAASEMYSWVTGKFSSLVNFIWGVVGGVRGAVGTLADVMKRPINAVIRAWNNIALVVPSMSLPKVDLGPFGSIGGQSFGGQRFDFPNIPELARGGSVLRTGLAVVHRGEQFSGVGKTFGASTVNIHVHTTGLGADSPDIQRAVMRALRGYASRNGALDVPVRGV